MLPNMGATQVVGGQQLVGDDAATDPLLETLAVAHRLPLDEVRSQRETHEPAVADVLDLVDAHPGVVHAVSAR